MLECSEVVPSCDEEILDKAVGDNVGEGTGNGAGLIFVDGVGFGSKTKF